MGTLYLDHKDLRLKRESGALALYRSGERTATVPFNLLERVVILGSVALDTGLIGALAEAGVSVLMLSGRRGRRQAMILGGSHGDAARRVGQYRLYGDPEWRRQWSLRLVRHKVVRQRRLLRTASRQRPDQRHGLRKASDTVKAIADRLKGSGCETLSLDTLRGMEGAAAAAYFEAYTRLFPESLAFHRRTRRPPRDPVNACLSLAYTLLHFDAVRACHSAGLDPLIGFYHALYHGRESLASDLLEPLRPYVDRWVWELFRAKQLGAGAFRRDGDACLLDKQGRAVFYSAYETFAAPLRKLLRRATQRAAKAIADSGLVTNQRVAE